MTPEQQALMDGVSRLLQSEARIEAAWLAGSLGKGEGDAFSDVDILALATDGAAAPTAGDLSRRLDTVATPVLVNLLFGGKVINVVTQDWGRFDINIVEADELSRFNANWLKPLFNRGDHAPPSSPPAPYVTAPETLEPMVKEFFRVLGLAVVVMGREEYVLALTGIDYLRQMTINLMLEENGVSQEMRGGMLHRNPLLTAQQRQALTDLPPLRATRESVLAGDQALAALFLPRAKRLAERIGMPWPQALEDATRASLSARLGLEI